jgi:hypothetical protein
MSALGSKEQKVAIKDVLVADHMNTGGCCDKPAGISMEGCSAQKSMSDAAIEEDTAFHPSSHQDNVESRPGNSSPCNYPSDSTETASVKKAVCPPGFGKEKEYVKSIQSFGNTAVEVKQSRGNIREFYTSRFNEAIRLIKLIASGFHFSNSTDIDKLLGDIDGVRLKFNDSIWSSGAKPDVKVIIAAIDEVLPYIERIPKYVYVLMPEFLGFVNYVDWRCGNLKSLIRNNKLGGDDLLMYYSNFVYMVGLAKILNHLSIVFKDKILGELKSQVMLKDKILDGLRSQVMLGNKILDELESQITLRDEIQNELRSQITLKDEIQNEQRSQITLKDKILDELRSQVTSADENRKKCPFDEYKLAMRLILSEFFGYRQIESKVYETYLKIATGAHIDRRKMSEEMEKTYSMALRLAFLATKRQLYDGVFINYLDSRKSQFISLPSPDKDKINGWGREKWFSLKNMRKRVGCLLRALGDGSVLQCQADSVKNSVDDELRKVQSLELKNMDALEDLIHSMVTKWALPNDDGEGLENSR